MPQSLLPTCQNLLRVSRDGGVGTTTILAKWWKVGTPRIRKRLSHVINKPNLAYLSRCRHCLLSHTHPHDHSSLRHHRAKSPLQCQQTGVLFVVAKLSEKSTTMHWHHKSLSPCRCSRNLPLGARPSPQEVSPVLVLFPRHEQVLPPNDSSEAPRGVTWLLRPPGLLSCLPPRRVVNETV